MFLRGRVCDLQDDQGSKRIDVEQVQEVVSQAIQNWTTQQQ